MVTLLSNEMSRRGETRMRAHNDNTVTVQDDQWQFYTKMYCSPLYTGFGRCKYLPVSNLCQCTQCPFWLAFYSAIYTVYAVLVDLPSVICVISQVIE